MRVLIVDDDPRITNLLREGLEEEGYQVVAAADGRTGVDIGKTGQFDVIILDLMLPCLDGYEVARTLRREGIRTPVLMLTARDANRDVIRGLDLGADDYLTKPFSFDVLLARIRAVARRGPVPTSAILRIGDLEVNPATHEASRAGHAIFLTLREFRLLELLARLSPRVVTRDAILEQVWGYDSEVSTNNLEVFVSALRAKVDTGSECKLIQTVRGVGYCLREVTE